jgi:AbrB family looped-hinge helix DNA binding protein
VFRPCDLVIAPERVRAWTPARQPVRRPALRSIPAITQSCGLGTRFVDKLWVRTRIGDKGRLVIPAALREALGMADGDVLDMRVVDSELRIATMRERLRRAQEWVSVLCHQGSALPTN